MTHLAYRQAASLTLFNCIIFIDVLQPQHLDLLLQKGVYPYDYMDSWEKFGETKLPPQKSFYSKLSESHISAADYKHGQRVWMQWITASRHCDQKMVRSGRWQHMITLLLLPGVVGVLRCDENDFQIELSVGTIIVHHLSVGGVAYSSSPVTLTAGKTVQWQ